MKGIKSVFLILLLLVLAAGCSQEKKETSQEVNAENKDDKQKKERSEDKKEKSKEEEEEAVEAESYEAEQTYEEIPFQNVNWFYGSPERQEKGGIWVFTGEKHAGEIDDTFTWEEEDVLLVQINDPQYKNHEMDIKGLQIIDDETVKIIVSVNKLEDEGDVVPRRYATIKKGSLEGKKFKLENEDTGEAIKLN